MVISVIKEAMFQFFLGESHSRRASKSIYRIKSYGGFGERGILLRGGVASGMVCPAACAAGLFLNQKLIYFGRTYNKKSETFFYSVFLRINFTTNAVRTVKNCLIDAWKKNTIAVSSEGMFTNFLQINRKAYCSHANYKLKWKFFLLHLRVSKSNDHMVVWPRNILSDFAQNLEICMPQLKIYSC